MAFPEPGLIPSLHIDPFAPVQFASTPVVISTEQESQVRALLLLTSADSRFAQKAADSLRIILLGGMNGAVVPSLSGVIPTTAVTGTTNVRLRVIGSGFQNTDVIYLNGNAMTTSFIGTGELNCTVNLTGVPVQSMPVAVRTSLGIVSNSLIFTVTSTTFRAVPETSETTEAKSEAKQRDVIHKEEEEEHRGRKLGGKKDA